jgi:hypothetical protein
MSRYSDHSDDDSPEAVLSFGRWQNNARRTLKSARGRKALAEIREALLALPEKRLIEGALCTVGGTERLPEVTEAEIDEHVAKAKAGGFWRDGRTRDEVASWLRAERQDERDAIAKNTEAQGCGVCVNGALLWHRLVKQQGMTPDEAFAALPAVATWDDGDPLEQTARIAEKDAGIAYTLAWELAYRNDEIYASKSPEDRYTAFLAWINTELGDTETSNSTEGNDQP